MKTFDLCKATRQQRNSMKKLVALLSGEGLHERGPFATKHGWPFYLIDTPFQTISVRSTKVKGSGKVIYVIYEGFGEMGEHPTHHTEGRIEAITKIEDILAYDASREFSLGELARAANRVVGLTRSDKGMKPGEFTVVHAANI